MSSPSLLLRREGLAVWSGGNGGERVLWIHGYTLATRIWEELWNRMPGWSHLGVDLPGHGASRTLAVGEDLPALARQLLRIAQEKHVRHVVGLSFGGLVALQLAIESPLSFTSLVLGSPALGRGPLDPHAQTRNLELAALYRERGAGPWLTEAWMRWPPEIFRGASGHPDLWRQLCAVVDEHPWHELTDNRMLALVGHPQPPDQLCQIRAATLVIVGEDDMATFKRSAELIRRAVPGARRVYLAGTGHLGLLEAPDRASRLLESHFRSGSASSVNDW